VHDAWSSRRIYAPKLTDAPTIRLLQLRTKAGVDVRVLGKVSAGGGSLRAQKLPGLCLHVRAMIRDGDTVFVGGRSLRALELDARREVGLIARPGPRPGGKCSRKTGRRLVVADDVAAVIPEG
jgi:hypothetical protein